MKNVYGVISNGSHVDVSNTELGAKNYATRHGFDKITCRYGSGYHVEIIAMKVNNKWVPQ